MNLLKNSSPISEHPPNINVILKKSIKFNIQKSTQTCFKTSQIEISFDYC